MTDEMWKGLVGREKTGCVGDAEHLAEEPEHDNRSWCLAYRTTAA